MEYLTAGSIVMSIMAGIGYGLATTFYCMIKQLRAENAELKRMVTNTATHVDRIESAIESGDIHGEG